MQDWTAPCAARTLDRARLRALSARSDAQGWLQIAGHLGALAAVGLALAVSPPLFVLRLALLGALGVLINCLYAGQHELSHWTAFRTKRLNDVFGVAFGFATLNPFYADRLAHFAHHRATQDPLRDSELMGRPPYTTTLYLLDLIAVSFWARRIRSILRTAAGRGLQEDYWLSAGERRLVVLEARVTVGLWALVAAGAALAGSWAPTTYWIGPLLATKIVHQLQNTGEHTALPNAPDILRNTRTLKGPVLFQRLLWNMSYHAAHHCFPGVPFHALPALHQEIARTADPPLRVVGYLQAQREIFSALSARPARLLAHAAD